MTRFKNDKKTLFLLEVIFTTENINNQSMMPANMVLIGVFRSGRLKNLVNAGHTVCFV